MRSKQEWSTPRTFANAAQEGGIVRSQPARHAVPSTTDMLKKSKFHIFYVHVRNWNQTSYVHLSSHFSYPKSILTVKFTWDCERSFVLQDPWVALQERDFLELEIVRNGTSESY